MINLYDLVGSDAFQIIGLFLSLLFAFLIGKKMGIYRIRVKEVVKYIPEPELPVFDNNDLNNEKVATIIQNKRLTINDKLKVIMLDDRIDRTLALYTFVAILVLAVNFAI